MTRSEVRRRLALEWWRWLGVALSPLFLLNLLFGGSRVLPGVLEMPLFIAGLASIPVTVAPRLSSSAMRGPEPHPASRIRRPVTSPASARIAGRS